MPPPTAHVVVLGPLGAGKSQLCSALAGLPANNEAFAVGESTLSVTQAVTSHQAKWLGRPEEEEFLVVDTCGVGQGEASDPTHIAELVHRLRELGYVSVFALVFNAEQPRLNATVQNMLRLLEECFGPSFWRNVALCFTRWYTDARSMRRRKKSSDELKHDWSAALRGLSPRSVELAMPEGRPFPCYFVDSEAAVDASADPGEREAALLELERLSMLARALTHLRTDAAGWPQQQPYQQPQPPLQHKGDMRKGHWPRQQQQHPEPHWSNGHSVQVTGLASAVSLNGQVGIVRDFDKATQRYLVEFPNGPMKKIREANLQPCSGSEPEVPKAQGGSMDQRADPSGPHVVRVAARKSVTATSARVGAEVERGHAWKWGEQDGGKGGLGRIVEPLARGSQWATVLWRTGGRNRYRVGADGQHDLQFASHGAFETSDAEERRLAQGCKAAVKAKHLHRTFGYGAGVRFPHFSRFDIREEVCMAVGGYKHGQLLVNRQAGRSAAVIGVKPDEQGEVRLWFHLEKTPGAGVFDAGTKLQPAGWQRVREAKRLDFASASGDEGDNKEFCEIAQDLQLTFGYAMGTGVFAHYARFDVREHVCLKVGGFKHGQELLDRSDLTKGVVIGVALGNAGRPALFIHMDGSPGAGKWKHVHAVRPMLRAVGTRKVKELQPDDPLFLDDEPVSTAAAALADGLDLSFGYPLGASGAVRHALFDVRDQVCLLVGGFKHGQVVRDHKGNHTSVVIGVRESGPPKNQVALFFHMDGNPGAGVFPRYHVFRQCLRVIGSREVVEVLPSDVVFKQHGRNLDLGGDLLRMLLMDAMNKRHGDQAKRSFSHLLCESGSDDEAVTPPAPELDDLEFDFAFPYPTGSLGTDMGLFDIRDETCVRTGGFTHGQVVQDHDGDTYLVIGVKLNQHGQPKLWFHPDDNKGAMVFGHYEVMRQMLTVVGTRTVQAFSDARVSGLVDILQCTFSHPAGLVRTHPARFDIRDEVCLQVGGFSHGQVVRDSDGDEMVVIGVKLDNGTPKLWYRPRGHAGAGLLDDVSDTPALAQAVLSLVGTEEVQEVV